MNFQQIRHATHIIQYKNKRFLVDPVLGPEHTAMMIPGGQLKKNPLVPLPVEIKDILSVDAILVTHTHSDHLDETAKKLLPKYLPIYVHPAEVYNFASWGFTNINKIEPQGFMIDNIKLNIAGGQHGSCYVGKLMGRTSGFILQDISPSDDKEPSVYIIGDSIWCDEVKETIDHYQPEVIIAYAGAAKLPFGDPITMGSSDITQLYHYYDKAKVIINHMDAWNHCTVSRKELLLELENLKIISDVYVPEDGELVF